MYLYGFNVGQGLKNAVRNAILPYIFIYLFMKCFFLINWIKSEFDVSFNYHKMYLPYFTWLLSNSTN